MSGQLHNGLDLVKAFHCNKKKIVACDDFQLQATDHSDMRFLMAELNLLLAKEMASELRVSQRTLYTLVDDGLPCFQARKTLLFDRDRVFQWLTKHERHGKRPSKNKLEEATP